MAPALAMMFALILGAGPEPSPPPVAKIDRSRVVGAPVLDGKTPPAEGVYVWLEDGLFHVAFVPPAATGKSKARRYSCVLSGSSALKPEKKGSLSFVASGGGLKASASVDRLRLEGALKAGDSLTVSEATGPKGRVPIFLGPTSTPGAATVTIGSFSPYRAPPAP